MLTEDEDDMTQKAICNVVADDNDEDDALQHIFDYVTSQHTFLIFNNFL